MTTALASWERQHYVPGGPAPFLFYVVFGEVDTAAPLSRKTYRSEGIPAGVDAMVYGPNAHPEVPGSFRTGYLWERLREDDAQLAATIEACEYCLVLRGPPSEPATLDYLRDTIGLLTHLLDHGGRAIYDPFQFRWWRPTEWKERIFAPAAAVPFQHV